jgi:cytochrome b involved in lipid metabolism
MKKYKQQQNKKKIENKKVKRSYSNILKFCSTMFRRGVRSLAFRVPRLRSFHAFQRARQDRFGIVAACLAGGVGLSYSLFNEFAPSLSIKQADADALPKKDWKTYTRADVAKHKTVADRIWVTYKDGVYDITEFVENHPGGKERIMLAAGGSVEPFWSLYPQHTKAQVKV